VNRKSDTIAEPDVGTRKTVARGSRVSVEPLMCQLDQGLPNGQADDVLRPESWLPRRTAVTDPLVPHDPHSSERQLILVGRVAGGDAENSW